VLGPPLQYLPRSGALSAREIAPALELHLHRASDGISYYST
jgi:hypothetical protein